jgi:hypothetical protein
MAELISQAVAQGYQSGIDMGQSSQRAQDETSLLSSRAEQAKMQTQEMRQQAQSRMSVMAGEKQVSLANANVDVATAEGRGQLLQKTMQLDAIKNDPVAMQEVQNQYKQNLIDQASASKEQTQIRVDHQQLTHDAVNELQLNPDNAQGWSDVINNAPDDKTKVQLQKLQQVYQGPDFQKLTDPQKESFNRAVLGHLEGGKLADQAQNNLANMAFKQLDEARRVEADSAKAQNNTQTQAAKQQGLEISKELADAKVASAGQQLEISKLVAASKKAETIGKLEKTLAGLPESIKNPDYEHNYLSPDKGKPIIPNPAVKRIQGQIDKLQGTETPSNKVPDKEQGIAQSVVAHGWAYEPKKYDYRVNAEGTAERKLKE